MATELGPTGKDIWEAYGAAQLDAPTQALIRELARCADVLDRINDVALGRQEGWASLVFDDMGEVHLSIDRVLDEQRKTQSVFKALYAELRTAGVRPGAIVSDEAGDEEPKGPDDMLAALRKKKRDRESQSG